MRNIKIKNVSVERQKISAQLVRRAEPLAEVILDSELSYKSFRLENFSLSENTETALNTVSVNKIFVELEDALPESNFVNFWFGEQLLMGTIFDEKSQVLSGYLPNKPLDEDKLKIEYPDGSIVGVE